MPKTFANWAIALFISAILLLGLLRTRLLPGAYCGICGNRLKRRSCCYAGTPAEHVVCAACGNAFVETPHRIITADDDPSVAQ